MVFYMYLRSQGGKAPPDPQQNKDFPGGAKRPRTPHKIKGPWGPQINRGAQMGPPIEGEAPPKNYEFFCLMIFWNLGYKPILDGSYDSGTHIDR